MPATSATATIGTLSQNTELQENHSSSRPPTNGPRPMPTPAIADQIPIALPRSSRGKMSTITDRVAGMIIAPPMPITARSTTSCPAFCANAASTLATPNSRSPDWSTRFRPKRSPSVPIVSRTPAKASR